MEMLNDYDVCIVGCGRWLRGDDQVGLRVAKTLYHSMELPRTKIRLTECPASDIPHLLDGVRLLIVIDAAKCGPSHPPGEFQRIDYRKEFNRIRSRIVRDSHSMGVDLGLSLCDVLGTLPETVWLYAISVDNCSFGNDMTRPVAAVVHKVSAAIAEDARTWLESHEVCHA